MCYSLRPAFLRDPFPFAPKAKPLLLPVCAYAAEDETLTVSGKGSSTWFDGVAGLSGMKVGTNGASIKVKSKATVETGHTGVVRYEFGVVMDGTFMVLQSHEFNLMPGANQPLENSFIGAQGVEYTVKIRMKFETDVVFPLNHTGRPIKVNP